MFGSGNTDTPRRHALTAYRLGVVPYPEALALQERLVEARKEGHIGDSVLLLQHPPVVTLGRAAKRVHLKLDDAQYAERGIALCEIGRGGDVTYHGPGQLVAYPIIDLKPDRRDVRKYVGCLEEAMLRTCADHGLTGRRIPGCNGAWLEDRKVGAVGVRISRWVTMHGLALNANVDLAGFGTIVPCGIHDRGVTSLAEALGREVDLAEVEAKLVEHLAACLDSSVQWSDGAPDLPEGHA